MLVDVMVSVGVLVCVGLMAGGIVSIGVIVPTIALAVSAIFAGCVIVGVLLHAPPVTRSNIAIVNKSLYFIPNLACFSILSRIMMTTESASTELFSAGGDSISCRFLF